MSYLYDRELEPLQYATSKELIPLILSLTKDKDGNDIFTSSLLADDIFKKCAPDYSLCWKRIAEEFQLFAGNTFANALRGYGVRYPEALADACDHLNISYSKNAPIEVIEQIFICSVCSKCLSSLTLEQQQQFIKEYCQNTQYANMHEITPQIATLIVQYFLKVGGTNALMAICSLLFDVWMLLLGRTAIGFLGYKFLFEWCPFKTFSFLTGPLGMAATFAWTAIDLAGPAYRVTIPAILQIIILRLKYSSKTTNSIAC